MKPIIETILLNPNKYPNAFNAPLQHIQQLADNISQYFNLEDTLTLIEYNLK